MDELYYRWDYCSMLFEMEADRFHTYWSQLEELGRRHVGYDKWGRQSKVRVWGSTPDGRRRYAVSFWGIAAYIVPYLPMGFVPFIRRLDVKADDAGVTGQQLDLLAHQLLSNENPYNISSTNSRLRVKTDDRDAGGRSLSIGSHKSDLRVSIYSRGTAPFCLEYQCRDRMLKRFLDTAQPTMSADGDPLIYWTRLKNLIVAAGRTRYSRALYAAGVGDYVPTGVAKGFIADLEQADAIETREPEDHQMEIYLQGLAGEEPQRAA